MWARTCPRSQRARSVWPGFTGTKAQDALAPLHLGFTWLCRRHAFLLVTPCFTITRWPCHHSCWEPRATCVHSDCLGFGVGNHRKTKS